MNNKNKFSIIKRIEDKYNVKAYVYGSGVREFMKEGFVLKHNMKILIDGKENKDILKEYPYDITFMSLEDFFNSRVVDIDKILLDSNKNPIAKGSFLKDLKRRNLRIDIKKIKRDNKTLLEYIPFIKEGYSVTLDDIYKLRGEIDLDIVVEILKEICSIESNTLGERYLSSLFYEISGVNVLFNKKPWDTCINRVFSHYNASKISTFSNAYISRTISEEPCEFDKFKMFCHYLVLYLYKQGSIYKKHNYSFDCIEYDCTYFLYKEVLKLNDDEIAIYLNEIEYINQNYFKNGETSLYNYNQNKSEIKSKLFDLNIDKNFLFATYFI